MFNAAGHPCGEMFAACAAETNRFSVSRSALSNARASIEETLASGGGLGGVLVQLRLRNRGGRRRLKRCDRYHLAECGDRGGPVGEHRGGAHRACAPVVLRDQRAQVALILRWHLARDDAVPVELPP